jgi:hypothetical protein
LICVALCGLLHCFDNVNKVLDLFPVKPAEIRAMTVGANVSLKDGRRGGSVTAAQHQQRNLLSSSTISSSGSTLLDRGNPLAVLFRDPEALKSVSRPIISGDQCGMVPYTREMSVGASMPGETSVSSVPEALLELISLLPPPHEFDGPTLPVDEMIELIRQCELPQPPPPEPLSATLPPNYNDNNNSNSNNNNINNDNINPYQKGKRLRSEAPPPGQTVHAPPSSDLYRMRQQLLHQQNNQHYNQDNQ